VFGSLIFGPVVCVPGATHHTRHTQARGTWRGAPLLGTLKDMQRKALETGISLHRGPTREPGRELIYQGL